MDGTAGSNQPTFSILIETANLAEADPAALRTCLDSIAAQGISPAEAEQVVLLDSGELASPDLPSLRRDYPWLSVRRVGADGYGDVKAAAAEVGTGDVVVLCDADCRYEPGWLEHLLAPFAARQDVGIVAGETTTPVDGAFGLAMALAFVFPRASGETQLSPARWYWANNVAFRRTVLEEVPLPSGLPLYRGQTIPHGRLLRAAGHTIWRQPLARAIHVLPERSELLRRFFLKGHDAYTISQLLDDRSRRSFVGGMEPGPATLGRVRDALRRARSVLAEEPRRALLLPVALPVVLLVGVAYLAGAATARARHLAPAGEGLRASRVGAHPD